MFKDFESWCEPIKRLAGMEKKMLMPSIIVKREFPVNYSEMGSRKDHYIIPEELFDPVFICVLKNAFASPYGIVFKKGKVIKESLYSMFTRNRNTPTFFKKIILGRVLVVEGRCIVFHNAFFDNYYHFTAEALPRLFLLKEQVPDAKVLLPEGAPKFVEAYLRFFKPASIVYLKLSYLARIETLILPTHTAKGLSHRPEVVRSMRSWFSRQIGDLKEKYRDYRNVYISRSKARWRRVKNEDAVIELLKQFEFKIINLEDFDVVNQISLFNNIRNLVGVHGAGFANIMHLPAFALFLSFIHEAHEDPAFYNLSEALGQRPVILECTGEQDTRGAAYNDLVVDTTKLKDLLECHMQR